MLGARRRTRLCEPGSPSYADLAALVAVQARLCLAADPDPVWPFSGSTAVDAQLSDDKTRAAWRARWHDELAALGIEEAAYPPPEAVDFLTPHEQEADARRRPTVDSRDPARTDP